MHFSTSHLKSPIHQQSCELHNTSQLGQLGQLGLPGQPGQLRRCQLGLLDPGELGQLGLGQLGQLGQGQLGQLAQLGLLGQLDPNIITAQFGWRMSDGNIILLVSYVFIFFFSLLCFAALRVVGPSPSLLPSSICRHQNNNILQLINNTDP